MKVFVFDPLWDELATPDLTSKLMDSGIQLVVETTIKPLGDSVSICSWEMRLRSYA